MKCLCASARHAARLLTRVYEEELRAAHVTAAQFELLATLCVRPGLPQSDLAEALFLDQTTLSRNIKVLIGLKWVKCSTARADHRQSIYTLTAAGRTTLRKALPHWERVQDRIQQSLGSDLQTVWSSLARVRIAASQNKEPEFVNGPGTRRSAQAVQYGRRRS